MPLGRAVSGHLALSPAGRLPDSPSVAVFNWAQDLDPDFPLAVVDFRTSGDSDRMHWHEYLEIVLCLEGTGRFLFGRRTQPIEPGDIFLVGHHNQRMAFPGQLLEETEDFSAGF